VPLPPASPVPVQSPAQATSYSAAHDGDHLVAAYDLGRCDVDLLGDSPEFRNELFEIPFARPE
jgi:hypothetical protein